MAAADGDKAANAQDDRSRRLKKAYDRLSLSQDVPARLRATAEKIVPFVPRRVESAFLSGVFNHECSSGGGVPLPSPRLFEGAVLLVCASYCSSLLFLMIVTLLTVTDMRRPCRAFECFLLLNMLLFLSYLTFDISVDSMHRIARRASLRLLAPRS